MYLLGALYHHGYHVTQDFSAAFDWYHQSAELDSPQAAYALSLLYSEFRDLERSRSFCRAAADLGHPLAQNNWGLLLETGAEGVEKNIEEAMRYYKSAVASGNSRAG
jgi:TPR repeat protein